MMMNRCIRYLATLTTLFALAGGSALPVQAGAPAGPAGQSPVKPTLKLPVQPQKRASAPSAVQSSAMPQTLTLSENEIHAMVAVSPEAFSLEAEEWGERPDLGFTVQDMSGWGSQWSGNKQIFWNPRLPYRAFKFDFSAPGGKELQINLTAAPDYANIRIKLGCYQQTSVLYQTSTKLMAEREQTYHGYAQEVTRKQVTFPIQSDYLCRNMTFYRLTFTAEQYPNRTFGGIDNIVVTK